MQRLIVILAVILFTSTSSGQTYQFAVLKYKGGGDYYSNPTAMPNLVEFCNQNLNMKIEPEVPYADIGSPELFNYPFIHMTGHGNVVFSVQDAANLRTYLTAGGFLHISDNYGMDKFIRKEMKKVFPEADFVELPFSHSIYHQKYDFANGLPKIHEHDNKSPKGLAIVWEGRVVCFYDYECDLGDGWEDWEVHKDSEETRTKALKMGANLVQYALTSPEEKK
ncbi:MAG: hypothetical protein RL220_313 [Bacteroidota bacterium]|jgi:hypothetical protein